MKKNVKYLDEILKKYGASDVYPFHMPGHKRQDMDMMHPELMDITEVDGFDNLHHAQGIIARAQDRMAKVFGAEKSFFLVNGSTAGLLAAISTSVSKGGKILIARNCHKAVYNAIYLRELSVEYLYPVYTTWGIQGSVDPKEVEKKLKEHPDIQAVLITSPTYDGVVSDIQSIAEIVHQHDIPLIVDEAHGAHFGFSEGFPKKALASGADLVIESMHKTLPAYTQTAALHIQGKRVSEKQLQKFLGIYQSSSPSYLFMAGLDRCTRIMQEQGAELMTAFEKRLADFYKKTKDLKQLKILGFDKKESLLAEEEVTERKTAVFAKDRSKILISCHKTGLSGDQLAKILLETYGLQMEMASGHYVTALTSLMDTDEGFARLKDALLEIDKTVEKCECADWQQLIKQLYQPKEKQMEIFEGYECPVETVDFKEAAGRVSAEFAYLYPPGVPFVAPGEIIPDHLPEIVTRLLEEGFEIQGLEDWEGKRINVAR